MKKLFFYASCTALMMSSCSNEIENISEMPKADNEIIVTTYNSGMTRADEVGLAELQKFGFNLYAYNNSADTVLFQEDFAYDKEVLSWNAEQKVYWPGNDLVTFEAFFADEESSNTKEGESWYFSNDGTKDIMFATVSTSRNKTNAGELNLQFNHLMAKVNVYVQGANNSLIYNVGATTLTFAQDGAYIPSRNSFEAIENVPYVLNAGAMNDAADIITNNEANIMVSTNPLLLGEGILVTPGISTFSVTYKACWDAQNTQSAEGTVNKTKEFQFQSGYVYDVYVTLTSGDVEIKVNATVNDWRTNDKNDDYKTTL